MFPESQVPSLGVCVRFFDHSKLTVLKMQSNFRLTSLPYYHRTAVEEQQRDKADQTVTARLSKSYLLCSSSCIERVGGFNV